MKIKDLFEQFDDDMEGDIPNPMPHITPNDPRYDVVYDAWDKVYLGHVNKISSPDDNLSFIEKIKKARPQVDKKYGIIESVDPTKLVGSEKYVYSNLIQSIRAGESLKKPSSELPIVLNYKGTLFIIDGNHRCVAAYLEQTPVKVRIFDYKQMLNDLKN